MTEGFRKEIEDIYHCLGDEQSKEIFADRLLYSFTGDARYIQNIVQRTGEGKNIYDRLKSNSRKKVIFGAGIWGKNILNAYRDVEFECFIDNQESDEKRVYYGLPVLSFSQFLAEHRDAMVVISSRLYHQEMYQQLADAGIPETCIIDAGGSIDQMSRKQYFDLPELKLSQSGDEVFVDGGSFDGQTSLQFLKWCGGTYKKIYAFEPDPDNIVKCENALRETCGEKFELVPKGVWNATEELSFRAIANGSSKVEENGNISIQVTSMDEVIQEKVTFIKLDVEGSEYQALEGAKNLIQKYKPKLAVSIYHKPEDIWELPEFIREMNSEYTFYLRHYSVAASETVLYAV